MSNNTLDDLNIQFIFGKDSNNNRLFLAKKELLLECIKCLQLKCEEIGEIHQKSNTFFLLFKILIEKVVAHIITPQLPLSIPCCIDWNQRKREWEKFIKERGWEYFLIK